jgi:hypothetical protein
MLLLEHCGIKPRGEIEPQMNGDERK